MSKRPTSLQSDQPTSTTQVGAFGLGVLAFGDSITNGGGEIQWSVALQSWAMWTARGLGVPFSSFAVDGAVVEDVVEQQIALFERVVADPYSRYALGCLYIGTNDIRRPGFQLETYERLHDEALGFMRDRCDRLLTLTIPLDMGRPRNPELIERVNAAIERSAERHGALVLDLRGFRGRRVMMADHVHPTALGQVSIAEHALDLLATDGVQVRVRPTALITPRIGRRGRLRGDWTYVYRHLKQDLALYIASRRRR